MSESPSDNKIRPGREELRPDQEPTDAHDAVEQDEDLQQARGGGIRGNNTTQEVWRKSAADLPPRAATSILAKQL